MNRGEGGLMRARIRGLAAMAVALSVVGAIPAGAAVIHPSADVENGPIFFDMYNEAEGGMDIYRMNPDGTGITNLTEDFPSASSPSVTPDGKRVYFSVVFDTLNPYGDSLMLYSMRPNGTEKLPVSSSREASYPSVAGDRLVYQRCNFFQWTCRPWTSKLDGTGARPLGEAGVEDNLPSVSPDGTRVVYSKRISGRYDFPQVTLGMVETVDSPSGNPLVTQLPSANQLGWVYGLSWSHDGVVLVGISSPVFLPTVQSASMPYLIAPDGSGVEALPWGDGKRLEALAISPDGRWLVGGGVAGEVSPLQQIRELRMIGVDGTGDHVVNTGINTQTLRLSWSVPTPALPPLPSAPDGTVESVVPGKNGTSLVVTLRTRRARTVIAQGFTLGAATASLSAAAPRIALHPTGRVLPDEASSRTKVVRLVLKAKAADQARVRSLLARGVAVDVRVAFLTRKGGERVRQRTVRIRTAR